MDASKLSKLSSHLIGGFCCPPQMHTDGQALNSIRWNEMQVASSQDHLLPGLDFNTAILDFNSLINDEKRDKSAIF